MSQRPPTETPPLDEQIAAARGKLVQLADRLAWAQGQAYAVSAQQYEPAGRTTPASTPPRGRDHGWARNLADAARAICWADHDIATALWRARANNPGRAAMATRHIRELGANPLEDLPFLTRVIHNAWLLLGDVPADLHGRPHAQLTKALRSIDHADQLIPDTRNPPRPRVCAVKKCDQLLGPDRGNVCAMHRKRAQRERERAKREKRAA